MISMMAGDVIDEKGDLICPPDGRLEDMLVGDLMFRSPSFVGTEDPVFDALEMLVAKGLSGVPVVRSGTMQVVGVVSGYDLLALDYTPGKLDRSSGLFPPLGSCDSFEGKKDLMWQQHFDLQARLAKSTGTRVEDIMHEATLVVQGMKLPVRAPRSARVRTAGPSGTRLHARVRTATRALRRACLSSGLTSPSPASTPLLPPIARATRPTGCGGHHRAQESAPRDRGGRGRRPGGRALAR